MMKGMIILIKICTPRSFYFCGKFSDLIFILNSLSIENITLKEYLSRLHTKCSYLNKNTHDRPNK